MISVTQEPHNSIFFANHYLNVEKVQNRMGGPVVRKEWGRKKLEQLIVNTESEARLMEACLL